MTILEWARGKMVGLVAHTGVMGKYGWRWVKEADMLGMFLSDFVDKAADPMLEGNWYTELSKWEWEKEFEEYCGRRNEYL